MTQHRSPWMRSLFGLAAAIGLLVAYAVSASLANQSEPNHTLQQDDFQQTLTFFHKSARLSADVKDKLDETGFQMKEKPDLSAQVNGYAGPDEANGTRGMETAPNVAQSRADHVRDYLVTRHGIDPSRITTTIGDCSPENDQFLKCQKAVLTLRGK